jgi:hypothetical protein
MVRGGVYAFERFKEGMEVGAGGAEIHPGVDDVALPVDKDKAGDALHVVGDDDRVVLAGEEVGCRIEPLQRATGE